MRSAVGGDGAQPAGDHLKMISWRFLVPRISRTSLRLTIISTFVLSGPTSFSTMAPNLSFAPS
jgi:hypothetical protein